MNLIYLFSILLFTIFIIIISVRTSRKFYTITNSSDVNTNLVNKALNNWNYLLNNNVIFDIKLDRQEIEDDTLIASSSIEKFNHEYIKGTIIFYPTFYTISDEEKLTTIIHEIGHYYCSNHLDENYYKALCIIGAKFANLVRNGEV